MKRQWCGVCIDDMKEVHGKRKFCYEMLTLTLGQLISKVDTLETSLKTHPQHLSAYFDDIEETKY